MTKIKIELEELIDFIKSCEMNPTIYRTDESNEICIEIDGYEDSGSVFCIDGEITEENS